MSDSTNDNTSTDTDHDSAQSRMASDNRATKAQPPGSPRRLRTRLLQRRDSIELAIHRWLVAHSIDLLRVSLGAVFLGFGFLKFFPDVSPAQKLVIDTTSILTFDLIPGSVAIVAVALLECIIGLWLLSGRALRGAIYLLVLELVGILAPIVLLGGRLFGGPHNAPTLQGQYVLKDVILVAAVLVLAVTVRGGRLTSAKRRASRPPANDQPQRSTIEIEASPTNADHDDDRLIARRHERSRLSLASSPASLESVRLDPELRSELLQRARSDQTTPSEIIHEALRRFLRAA
jgi:uncharacterized membrane protein YphA (DoxX/SURF4 family)